MKNKSYILIFIFLTIVLNIRAEEFKKIFKLVEEIELQQNSKVIIGSVRDFILDNNLIYIVDSKASNIKIYNLNGAIIKIIGNKGTGPGEFQFPYAIDIDEEKIYITDIVNRRLNIFDKQKLTFNKSFYILDGRTIRVINNKIFLSYVDLVNKKSLHIYDYNGKLLNSYIDIPKITLDNQLLSDFTTFDVDNKNNIYFLHEMKYEVIRGVNNNYSSFITRERDKYYIPPPQKPFQDFHSRKKSLDWINSWSHISKLVVSNKNYKLLVSFHTGSKIYLDIYSLTGKLLYKNIESNMRLLFTDDAGYIYFLQESFDNNNLKFVIKKYAFK